MRTSYSLTSIFSSLLSPTYGPNFLFPVPSIQVIKASESSSNLYPPPPPRRIRRWRGALGTMGDYTLQLPSQGPTSAARLALARQGCATGSFRLNCSESLYVVDSRGRAMFERIQLEEELEAGLHGLMEKPPTRTSDSASETASTSASSPLASVPQTSSINVSTISPVAPTLTRKMTTRRVSPYGGKMPHRRSSARRRKPIPTSMNMRFDSSGLSSCATFTEGLCELDEYVDSTAVASFDKSTARLSASFSAHEIGADLPILEAITWNLNWLSSSLKKRSNPNRGATKKKHAAKSSLARSFTNWDLTSLFVENQASEPVETPASSVINPAPKQRKVQKRQPRERGLLDSVRSSSSLSKLPRDGSWSKLRKKFSTINNVTEPVTTIHDSAIEEKTPGSPLNCSISVSSAIFSMTQRVISVTGCAAFEWGELHVNLPE